jgi:tetratricopeptide (TPR) repeat protein
MRQTGTLAARAFWLVGLLPVLAGMTLRAEEPAKAPPRDKPAWQRLLQGEDARKAAEQENQLLKLQEKGEFENALKVAEALAELRAKKQGADHWEAVNAHWQVEALRRVLRQDPKARDAYAGIPALLRRIDDLEPQKAQPLIEKVLAIRRQVLGEEHPDTAISYQMLAQVQNDQSQHAAAEEGFRKALAIQRKLLGEKLPALVFPYSHLAVNAYQRGDYKEAEAAFRKVLDINRKSLGEENSETATSYNNVAHALDAQARYAEAEESHRKALAINRRTLGEENLGTANNYTGLATNLDSQGRYRDAEESHRKALAICRKLLGEEHSYSCARSNDLAVNLTKQGRLAEGEAVLRQVLALRRKSKGEEHEETALSYNNLAYNLNTQGRYAEAAEGYRKALDICRRVLGEEHSSTAVCYSNVANNLFDQRRYAEAEEGFRRALAIYRKVRSDTHSDMAGGYNNVAAVLHALGNYKEAAEFYRKSLDVCRKIFGEQHSNTLRSYDNLTINLMKQGRYAEAEEICRKSLAISREILGEEHPDTATFYFTLGSECKEQGRHAEAEAAFRKSLEIRRKTLGEEHIRTAQSYDHVASSLHARGQYTAAQEWWLLAADSFAKARLRIAAVGLERAVGSDNLSPLPELAAVLARNGKPEEAWQRFEEGLARGTWDDLTARLRRSAAEQTTQIELINRLERLDQLIEKTLPAPDAPPDEKKRRADLLTQRRQVHNALSDFGQDLKKKYGLAAGQVFERPQIQASLPANTALLGWLDEPGAPKAADPDGEHWAVLLRSAGGPVWVRLRGSGGGGAWTDADADLPNQLRAALQSPSGDWRPLAAQLRRQRLEPLAKHLAAGDGLPAVRHLVVLPSPALAGVPTEVFADSYTVSYTLSGTLHDHLRQQPRVTSKGLLAVADPVFEMPSRAAKPSPLPPAGVLLTMVVPGSNAARAGLRPNDVLLRYNDNDLLRPADLKPLPESPEIEKRVAVTIWRDGQTSERQIRPGKLGVVLADEPAPQAMAQQRKLDLRLASAARGGDKWSPLPGTLAEVETLRPLFDNSGAVPKVLVHSEASEQRLDELAKNGELSKYRYLHLATHGETDDRFPLRSAVILSRDQLPDAYNQLKAGLPVYDGQLTAAEVLRQWHLRSELVTLSACQSALGRYERGEGFVGFAQALILAGSRSVCLSLWKVDDAATALLMARFYCNLLGQRENLKGPMGKAQALAEAKDWLRNLPREAALGWVAQLNNGVTRAKGRQALPLLAVPAKAKEDRPYAHPYYWAAFLLIGDPN